MQIWTQRWGRLLSIAMLLWLMPVLRAQEPLPPAANLPDAPTPQIAPAKKKDARPLVGPANCVSTALTTTNPEAASAARVVAKPCARTENPFQRFVSTSVPDPLTPKQKLRLAQREVTDPFNLITIGVNSTITVAANPYSLYGPGLKGFGYNVGVSLSQDVTGAFFNTFLIPSVMHQDPRYHRMPGAHIFRRTGHVVISALVMQGDDGRPMLNYADIIGIPIDNEIADLYVPGLQTNLRSTVARSLYGLASVPIGNMIAEFLPDVAKHISIHVLFVQRIINRVAPSGDSGAALF